MRFLIIVFCVIIVMLTIVFSSRTRLLKLYKRYNEIPNKLHMTGEQFAFASREALDLQNVRLSLTDGVLSDAYSKKTKTLYLSQGVCDSVSVASVAIISHEFGHAVQDKQNNKLFIFTHSIKRFLHFFMKLVLPMFLVGLVFRIFNFELGWAYGLIGGAVGLILLQFLIKLLTIPLEQDASKRAINFLRDNDVLDGSDLARAKKLLKVAAQTYICALFDEILVPLEKFKNAISGGK